MATIKELVKQMGGEQKAASTAYRALEDMATRAGAPGSEARRATVAADLGAELTAMTEPKKDEKGKDIPPRLVHSSRIRAKVARLLSYVAGAEEVPALVQALGDLEVREMARFALDRNISAAATEALIKALDDQVGPIFRTGIVSALGKRKGANVLSALQKAAEHEKCHVRIAAIEALANFADASNDAFIAKATRAQCPGCRARANKARVRLAETLCQAGNKPAARRIYKAIRASNAEAPQKKAAEIGLKSLAS